MTNSLDSAFDSQKYFSQSNNNSQMSTQDLFAPNSQNEKSNEKMSMYEKWLSKRSLFKHSTPKENKVSSWPSCSSQSLVNQARHGSNKSDHFTNSQSEADMRMAMQWTNKGKAVERDERDLLEQIANSLQENNNETKGFASDMRDAIEKLGELSREETRQTMVTFMDSARKFQDNLLASFQAKEQISTEMDDLKKVMSEKNAEILNLHLKLEVAEKRSKEEMIQFTNSVTEELKVPQEKLTMKLEEISKRMNKVYDSLNVCKENIETQMREHHTLAESTPIGIKEMEKRLMKELKKVETNFVTSLNVRETVEGCLENSMVEIQDLSRRQSDSLSKKTKSDIKDIMTAELKKMVEICLRKNLKTVCDQLEELSHLYKEGHVIQGSYIQAAADQSLEKIKLTVEKCKTNFGEETSLLKQINQRLKQCTENVCNHSCLHGCPSGKSVGKPLQLSSLSNNTACPSLPDLGYSASNCHRIRNGSNNCGHVQHSSGISGNGFSTTFTQNPPKSSTLDISCKLHQNNSFSTQNVFSQHPSTGGNNFSCCLSQQQTRMPGVNEFVETKKVVLTSKPDLSIISPFRQLDDIRIDPSPVATVKPQRRIDQTRYPYSGQENEGISSYESPYQECRKYDLRKRKNKEVPSCSKTNKEPKCDHKDKNVGSFHILEGSKKRTDNSYHANHGSSRQWQNYSNNTHEQYCDGQRHKHPLQMQTKETKDMDKKHHQNCYHLKVDDVKDERISNSLSVIGNNNRQKANKRDEEMHSQFGTGSRTSSPACSVYSIRIKTPLRHIASVQASRRRGGVFKYPLMIGKTSKTMNSSQGTLLSDM